MATFAPGVKVEVLRSTYDNGRDGGPEQPPFEGLTGQVERIDRQFVVVTLDFPVEQVGSWEFYSPTGWYFYPEEIRIIPAEED